MTMLPVLYVSWTAFAVLFLTLQVYRSTLTRYEDEKLFLDGLDPYGEKKQTDIIRKVTRTEPAVRLVGAVASIISVSIIGIFVYRAILVLQS